MELVTTREAAAILNLSTSRVRRLVVRGDLRGSIKVGQRDRFNRSDIEKLRDARAMITNKKYGLDGRWLPVHGEDGTRLYEIWDAMRRRGSRGKYTKKCYVGVTCCKEWQKYIPFAVWAKANGYQEHLTLDRKDSTKGYSPDNCRWVTYTENNRNRRNVRFTMESIREIRRLRSQGMLQREIAERFGVNQSQISPICSGKRWREETPNV